MSTSPYDLQRSVHAALIPADAAPPEPRGSPQKAPSGPMTGAAPVRVLVCAWGGLCVGAQLRSTRFAGNYSCQWMMPVTAVSAASTGALVRRSWPSPRWNCAASWRQGDRPRAPVLSVAAVRSRVAKECCPVEPALFLGQSHAVAECPHASRG